MLLQTAIFLISAAVLALEVILVRALSIGHWHHFSYLVISTALLGFGAGGIFVSLAAKYLELHHKKTLWASALAFAAILPITFQLSQNVPFDEIQIIWDARQILYLFAYYLLFFVPFLCAGSFIALAFTVAAEKAHRLYFYNLLGSGLGAAAALLLMYGHSPEQLLLVVSSIGFLAALTLALSVSRASLLATCALSTIILGLYNPLGPLALNISISENKSLVYYRALPGSKTLTVRYSPLARLDCLEAPAIRYFPGLSIAYRGHLPEQRLIISDADGISAVNHFKHPDQLTCYDHTTSALPYHLCSEPNVCIIGAGGGSDVAQALTLNANHVTAVEMNAQIIDLVRHRFDKFAAGIYNRPDVRIVAAEGRTFLQTTRHRFDLVNISLLDSFTASAAGVYALNESHLYTIQAVRRALKCLAPQGFLSITRLLKTPPKDTLKTFATVTEALRAVGIKHPENHIIAIRSHAAATIIVSPGPIPDSKIEKARRFAASRNFDLIHLPGIKPEHANRFHIFDQPLYYQSAQKILSPSHRQFYRDYLYNIRPATDDRPYFFDFFKWKSLPYLIRTMPRQWLPFSEWGYLVLVATGLQALFAGTIFILLPLWLAKPLKTVTSGKSATLAFFLLLGLAFMFLEMGFIQKMTMLIGHPVFGVAVTLVAILTFSAFGSLTAEHIFPFAAGAKNHDSTPPPNSTARRISAAVFMILLIGIAEITILTFAFEWLVAFARPARILWGLLIITPPAFFMGMPFPSALKSLGYAKSPLLPWAWAVNGFASVIGAVLGTCLAISLGFTALILAALTCYILAAIIAYRVFR